MEQIIPYGMLHYEHQVAGHGCSSQNILDSKREKNKPMLLHSRDERCVYKPVQAPPKGDREVQFYKELFSDPAIGNANAAIVGLRKFVPQFLGVYRSSELASQQRYLRLGDLLQGFVRPSVVDLKLGARTYEPDAPESKVAIELRKYKHREAVGFLVTGMRIWREDWHRYELVGKRVWTEVTPETVDTRVLPPFLSSISPVHLRQRSLRHLLCHLERLLDWFESQTVFHFYSSSILLALESSPAALASSAEEFDPESSSPLALVALVDFTHVRPATGLPDENCTFGLRNLIRLAKSHLKDLQLLGLEARAQ